MLILLIGCTKFHVNSLRIVVNVLIGYIVKSASLAYYGIDSCLKQ